MVSYIFLFFQMSIAHSCARVTGGAGANVLICVCLPFALGTQCVCVCFFYNLVGLVKTVIDCNTFHSHPSTVCLTAGRPIALVLCACISQSIDIFGKYLSCIFYIYLWYIFNIHVFLPSLVLVVLLASFHQYCFRSRERMVL